MTILDPRVWLAAILACVLAYGGGRWQQRSADSAKYSAQQTVAAYKAAQEQVKAVNEARTEEQRRTAAQTEIANNATSKAETSRVDADAARAANGRLQQRVAELLAASRAGSNPAGASTSAPASDAAGMFADLLGKSVERNQLLAEYADSARIAGEACERSYDALTSVTDQKQQDDQNK